VSEGMTGVAVPTDLRRTPRPARHRATMASGVARSANDHVIGIAEKALVQSSRPTTAKIHANRGARGRAGAFAATLST
jgi:hypothetical protein